MLAFALARAGGDDARAQGAAVPYYWSAYPNAEASLVFTTGVAVDGAGNVFASLVTDHQIVKISATGEVTGLAGTKGASGSADGIGATARFNAPQGLTADGAGNVFVAEFGSSTVRRISSTGVVTTIAGRAGVTGSADGVGANARFASPRGAVVDGDGKVFVADTANTRIRMVWGDGFVQTVAGGTWGSRDAVGTIAQFMAPWGIARDRAGSLYVTDFVANTVRKLTGELRISTTLAGTAGAAGSADGVGAAARFNQPTGIAVDGAGNVFVTDTQNRTIRRIAPDGQVTTIGGRPGTPNAAESGIGSAATFIAPYGIAVTPAGILYVADYLGIRRGEAVQAPAIAVQPGGLVAQGGTTARLSVTATGVPPPSFQWRRHGTPIEGATLATLTLEPARAQHAGDYSVVVANSLGAVTSAAAPLVVHAAPTITAAPQPATLGANGTAVLTVAATSPEAIGYQWLRDGQPIAGATAATLRTTDYGRFTVAVSNPHGTTTSEAVLVDYPGRLVNLSASGTVGTGAEALVAGLVVVAPEGARKTLLLRAVGPTLALFGVPGALPRTTVSLLDERGALVARNSGWATHPVPTYTAIAAAAAAVGAFDLPAGSGDSALLVEVPRGRYTVAVEAAGGATSGAGLVEVYEAREDAGRLANLSTRVQLGAGGGITVGFVAFGSASPNLLVRAVGPGLVQFGVAGALAQPVLTVFSGARRIAANAGWVGAANAAQIERAGTAAGAFPLSRDAADAALLLTLLESQNYTAQVTSADGAAGVVLIEIYQVF